MWCDMFCYLMILVLSLFYFNFVTTFCLGTLLKCTLVIPADNFKSSASMIWAAYSMLAIFSNCGNTVRAHSGIGYLTLRYKKWSNCVIRNFRRLLVINGVVVSSRTSPINRLCMYHACITLILALVLLLNSWNKFVYNFIFSFSTGCSYCSSFSAVNLGQFFQYTNWKVQFYLFIFVQQNSYTLLTNINPMSNQYC